MAGDIIKGRTFVDNHQLIATGRLRRGRLHGFVVIKGIVSNDPNNHCASTVMPGLGFIGHFKDGIPHGVCWKGLLGGASIYGEVDKKGHFTGKKIVIF